MRMQKMFKNSLAVALLAVGLFDLNPVKLLDNKPDLEIEKPTVEVIENTNELSNIITKSEDRVMVAVLANEFSNRLLEDKYDSVKFQTVNDVYVEASKIFYTKKMSDEYPKFPEGMKNFLEISVGSEDDIILTDEQRQSLVNNLKGLAWSLTQ